jgi:hypothetical protein
MSEPREAGPVRLRASDAEREEVAEQLRTAMGEGRLTLDEGEQRLVAAYAATHRDELPALTADLPAPPPPRGARPARTGQRSRSWPASWRGLPAGPLLGLGLAAVALVGLWTLVVTGSLWLAILAWFLVFSVAKRHRSGSWSGSWSGAGRPGRCGSPDPEGSARPPAG